MREFTIYIFAVLLFSCYNTLTAQQQYEARHYGGPGTVYLYNRITGLIPPEGVTMTGAEVTWDFSDTTELNTHPTQIVTPGAAMDQTTFLGVCFLSGIDPFACFTIWSQTEQALLLEDSLSLFGYTLQGLQRFQNKVPNLLLENFFGFTFDLGGTLTQAAIVYQQPDTIYTFPLRYADNWTSRINWTLDLSLLAGQNVQYKSHQIRSAEVDGWGTVITPYDTFTNVLRLRTEIERQDTLISDSISLPINLIQVEYMWFDTNYKLPVMVANGIVADTFEVINSIEYIYEATCPEPTWSVDTGSDFYYIDTSGTVTVNFEITDPNAGIYTWDFGDGESGTSEGNTSHTYSLPGYYLVNVTGCMTNCLPLNSCVDQLIDFEVIDTLFQSVVVTPGEELGIRLYPNPATESIAVDVPSHLGQMYYEIGDMTGRKILYGTTGDVVRVGSLAEGIYYIRFRSLENVSASGAIMRFVIKR